MRNPFAIFDHWPTIVALGLSTVVGAVTLEEKLGVELKLSLLRPEAKTPDVAVATPPREPLIPLAPAPGWDDRTPVEYMSRHFGLDDPFLTEKLSGIGATYWKGAGRGTGALIAQDVVLSTGHLFAENGYWEKPNQNDPLAPDPSNGSMYLAACGRSYEFVHVELGSMAPRQNLGRDYAIARLVEPACASARILGATEISDRVIEQHDEIAQPLLNMGSYAFADIKNYASHPFFTQDWTRHPQHLFGVRCRMDGFRDTGGEAGLIFTDGCDGVPGGSGGPLLLSLDGGETYRIVGVANSYSKTDSEFNNFTRVTGRFASHLMRFVPDIFDQ